MNESQSTALTYQGKPRTCGFRLSITDVLVLILGTAAGVVGWFYVAEIALFAPYVVGHFFLFCNVFRVRRKPELVWAATFLINTALWLVLGNMNIYGILSSQLIMTAVIIIREIRTSHYHGIFSRQINTRIDDYLEGKV